MHKNDLLIECRLISTNKKIDYWLIDWFSKQENRLLSRFVDMKMFYVNFSFNSREFVLWFRDFFSKKISFRENSFCCFIHEDSFCDFVIFLKNLNWTSNEQHSSFSKKKLFHFRKFTIIFVDLRLFSLIYDAHNENEIHSSFSKKKISHFDDFISFIRVFRRAIYSKQKIWSSVN